MTLAILAAAAVVAAASACWLWSLRHRLLVVTVDGPSMEPTYHQGDRVIVRRSGVSALSLGDVVVIEGPNDDGIWPQQRPLLVKWQIKRVVALPGGRVPTDRVPALASHAEGRVPPGKLVLLGDNAANSYDSRYIGYFPADRLLGVVLRPLAQSSR